MGLHRKIASTEHTEHNGETTKKNRVEFHDKFIAGLFNCRIDAMPLRKQLQSRYEFLQAIVYRAHVHLIGYMYVQAYWRRF